MAATGLEGGGNEVTKSSHDKNGGDTPLSGRAGTSAVDTNLPLENSETVQAEEGDKDLVQIYDTPAEEEEAKEESGRPVSLVRGWCAVKEAENQ